MEQTAVSKWELGKSFPNTNTAKKLVELFNAPLDIIMGRETDEFAEKIDYTRGLKLIIDDAVSNAKVTGVSKEVLYQITSFALPGVYYNVLNDYRRDENLQEFYKVWKELDFHQKREVIGYANAVRGRMDGGGEEENT